MERLMNKGLSRLIGVNSILMLSIFTFLFLGIEYLYVDMISLTETGENVILAQNYALGASAVGFFLYPLIHRFLKCKARSIVACLSTLTAAPCIFIILRHPSYITTLCVGMALFLFLGLFGSAVHHKFIQTIENTDCLARKVGISYALGILFQFLNNNLVNSAVAETIILSVFLFVLLALLLRDEWTRLKEGEQSAIPISGSPEKSRKRVTAGILLAVIVMLMSCIFSTLDNAVTMRHAAGTDIGKWPRLLLALSGLAAGFIFDIQKRKFMNTIMYCVMMLSVICIVVLKLDGPFHVGLMVFYLSSGFFVVFFTSSFMELSRNMRIPELWAGMGRAVNNACAAVLAGYSVMMLTGGDGLTSIIVALVLFVAVSVFIAVYSSLSSAKAQTPAQDFNIELTPEEALAAIAERFSLTPRETDVLDKLVNTEKSVQEIADNLYLSRRTCQRHISAIYEKTGIKSRVGLYQMYIDKQHNA